MKVVVTAHAREDIEQRFAYSVEHFGQAAAERIFQRVDTFITKTLAWFPFTGQAHPSGVLETWVPKTPFFIIYRVDKATAVLTILAVYHHAQDRTTFRPDTSET